MAILQNAAAAQAIVFIRLLGADAEEFAALWNRSGIKRHTMQVTTVENMQSGFTRKVFGFTLKSGK